MALRRRSLVPSEMLSGLMRSVMRLLVLLLTQLLMTPAAETFIYLLIINYFINLLTWTCLVKSTLLTPLYSLLSAFWYGDLISSDLSAKIPLILRN